MSIVITSEKIDQSTNDQTADYTPSTWTPVAGRVYFACIFLTATGSTPDTPTLTGNGMTWTQLSNGTFNGTAWRGTTFWAYDPNPTAGAMTIGLGGSVTHTGYILSIVGAQSALTSGNPYNAFNSTSGSNTSGSTTLASFAGSANICWLLTATNPTKGANYTALDETTELTPACFLNASWWQSPSDGIANGTWANSAFRVMAINVADAGASTVPAKIGTYFERRRTG